MTEVRRFSIENYARLGNAICDLDDKMMYEISLAAIFRMKSKRGFLLQEFKVVEGALISEREYEEFGA